MLQEIKSVTLLSERPFDNVQCLLFADDLALLSSNKSDLQYAFDQFDAFLDAGMKISTAKTEIMFTLRHPVQCSFQTNEVTLKQMKKFILESHS